MYLGNHLGCLAGGFTYGAEKILTTREPCDKLRFRAHSCDLSWLLRNHQSPLFWSAP
jgi:hypothetical protein